MFAENLRKCRKMRGMTQCQLAERLGVAKSSISSWETGYRSPDFEMIEAIADELNVGLEDLGDVKPISTQVPVLGYVRAGIPLDAIEEIIDYEEIPRTMALQGEYFGLKIRGDSMEPRIKEGDVVICRQQENVDNGDIAVVLINGSEATLKKYVKSESGISLISFNPKYGPFFFTPQEVEALPVRIIGKVVELRAKF